MVPKLFAKKICNNNKCKVGVVLILYHEKNTICDSFEKKIKKWCVIVMWHFNQCYGILINIILT